MRNPPTPTPTPTSIPTVGGVSILSILGGGVAGTCTNRKGLRTAAAEAAVNMNMGGDDNKSNNSREGEEEIEEDDGDGDGDAREDIFRIRIEGGGEEKNKKKKERRQLLDAFGNSFLQVQTVLDQNRALITQANDNHQSKLPENLSRNVALIRQINANIAKAVSIYSDLSANFSNIFQHHRRPRSSSSSDGDSSN